MELVPGASYFDAVLRDHLLARAEYFEAARQVLRNSDLVFVDPDNGIQVPSTKLGAAGSSKYVYWKELQTMYAAASRYSCISIFLTLSASALFHLLPVVSVKSFPVRPVRVLDGARGVLACATTKARRGAREGRTRGGAAVARADRSLASCNQRTTEPWVEKDAAGRASHP